MVKVLNNIEEARQYNEQLVEAHEFAYDLHDMHCKRAYAKIESEGNDSLDWDEFRKVENKLLKRMADLEEEHRDVCWEWDLELLF